MLFRQRIAASAVSLFAKAVAVPYYRRFQRRFEATLQRAHAVQRQTLFDKLRRCAATRFGRDHRFSEIQSIEDFRRRVPISRYEYLEPYIRAVSEGDVEALFPPTEKIIAFACTSGTTGVPKLNPVTQTWLREYRRAWLAWGVKAIVEHPDMIGTKILQLSGPGGLDKTPTGLPIGMVSAIAGGSQSRLVQSFYANPRELSDIHETTAKYYTTLRVAIAARVGFLISVTPSNLLRLAEVGDEFRESLIRDLHDGTLRADLDVSPELRRKLSRRIQTPDPHRARELECIVERTGTLYPKDYWPLGLLACWIGGTIGYQTRNLPRYYGATPTRDVGLVSTEGRHTIPLHDDRPEGVLVVDGNYYEFIPVEDIDAPNPRVYECHELEPGREYYLLMTTSSGMYRYDIEDVVRCQGYVGQAPILEFLYKAGQYADMEGEKISGHQMAQAVDVAARELGLHVDCFTAVPVRQDGEVPYYAVLVEQPTIQDVVTAQRFLQIVDRELIRQNVMYAGKRNDKYIDWPRLVRLAPGTWSEFEARESERRGTGASQYKHASLVPDTSWLDRFRPLDSIKVEANFMR